MRTASSIVTLTKSSESEDDRIRKTIESGRRSNQEDDRIGHPDTADATAPLRRQDRATP